MGSPIGKENVMMVESSSDGNAFHSNGTLCQSLSNTSIDAHFLPLSPVAPREMILSASFSASSPLSAATERISFSPSSVVTVTL